MTQLRQRFGRLVAAHRRRAGLTQGELAEAASISVEMVSKIETGASGARFPVIERLAGALRVDPAELFTTEILAGALSRQAFVATAARLAALPPQQLPWINNLLDAALKTRVAGDGRSAEKQSAKLSRGQQRAPKPAGKPKRR